MAAPELPPVVETARLTLSVITPATAVDVVAGRRQSTWHPDFPRPDDRDAASMVPSRSAGGAGELGEVERIALSWGPRLLARRSDGVVFGSIGFFGPPSLTDGMAEAEVGYGMVAEARGRGLASEALAALLAETDRIDVRIRAATAPDNAASLRVLAKAGFTGLRGADEDGNLVMVRPLRTWPGMSPLES